MPFSSLTSITFVMLWGSYRVFFPPGKIDIVGSDYSIFACPLIFRLHFSLFSVCADLFSACGGFACFQDENQGQAISFLILFLFFLFSLAFNSDFGLSLAGGIANICTP